MKWFEKIKNTFDQATEKENGEKKPKLSPKKKPTQSKEATEILEENKEELTIISPKKKQKSTETAPQREIIGTYSHILLRPMISEKSTRLSAMGQYVFAVSPRSNKIQIREAIADVYGVKPVSVAVSIRAGKKVRYGKKFGKRRDQKVAIVTLKKGDVLHVYEGV